MTARTLVLDVGYQPHRIVNWQRAVELIFGGKAQVVESYDEPLMTDDQASRAQANGWTLVLKIPAVVRLLRQPVKPKSLPVVAFHVDTAEGCPAAWRSFLYWNVELEHD